MVFVAAKSKGSTSAYLAWGCWGSLIMAPQAGPRHIAIFLLYAFYVHRLVSCPLIRLLEIRGVSLLHPSWMQSLCLRWSSRLFSMPPPLPRSDIERRKFIELALPRWQKSASRIASLPFCFIASFPCLKQMRSVFLWRKAFGLASF